MGDWFMLFLLPAGQPNEEFRSGSAEGYDGEASQSAPFRRSRKPIIRKMVEKIMAVGLRLL